MIETDQPQKKEYHAPVVYFYGHIHEVIKAGGASTMNDLAVHGAEKTV